MKLVSFISLCLGSLLPALAGEVYFGNTTPDDVASVHEVQPPATSTNGAYKLEAVFGIALAGPLGETAFVGGGIHLTQVAISPTMASSLGYSSYTQDALNSALVSIQGQGSAPARVVGASEYRYGLSQGGGNALWDIQFDGVPDYNDTKQNFFRVKLDEAVASARTSIRANPFHIGAGSGYSYIFQAAYEATVPYTYAGNEWRAKAERERIGITATLASPTARLAALDTASQRFRTATAAFLSFLNHPVESAWMLDPDSVIEGTGPAWAGGSSWADLLYEAYAEALTRYADSRFEYYYTRYLAEYQPPGSGNTVMQQLRTEIETTAAEIDRLVLPLAALSTRGITLPTLDIHAPSSRAQLLRRLSEHVQERSLFFSAGENPFASQRTSFRTYGPNFVPFLTPANLADQPFTFDNLLSFIYGINGNTIAPIGTDSLPNSLIGVAIQSEKTVSSKLEAVLTDLGELELLRGQTQDKYTIDLKQLCGTRFTDPNNQGLGTVPDIITYLAPPEDRPDFLPGESHGDIGLSWKRIEQAETRLFSAYRALAEIDEEAALIREFGDERLKSYEQIARIQIDAGQEISALDYLSGEVRANAILDEAKEREKQAKKKNWFGAIANVVVRATAAYITAGASETLAYPATWAATREAGGALGLIDQNSNAKSQAEMHKEIGKIQAEAARREAEINAQRTKIRAMEAASITMQQASLEENRILEAIYKLMIRVERQKLEILLAQQALEYAEMEHANLIAKIGSLIEEYRRVSIRQANLLLNRPDVRLVRDFEIMEAGRRFRVAQEYAFLLGRSADYRFAGRTNSPFRARIRAEIQEILKAQNATQIKEAVDELINIRGEFFAGPAANNQLSGLLEVRFSLRDLVAQSNSSNAVFFRKLNGEIDEDLGYMPGDLQPFPESLDPSATSVPALSEAQFTQYLAARLSPAPNTNGEKILRIPFAIGLEPTKGLRTNPLRQAAVLPGSGFYGMVIEGPSPGYISSNAVGVFANVRLRRNIDQNVFNAQFASLTPLGSYSMTRSGSTGSTSAILPENIDIWDPAEMSMEKVSAPIRILKNRDTTQTGWKTLPAFNELSLDNNGFHLHERSPVNDHWLLEVQMLNSSWETVLGNILDIELCMTLRAWK